MAAAPLALYRSIAIVDWPPKSPQSIRASCASALVFYQDRADDHVEKVISARHERRLIPEPCERSEECEQVSAVNIGARRAVGLSVGKKVRARRSHCFARNVKRRVRVGECRYHRIDGTAVTVRNCDGRA